MSVSRDAASCEIDRTDFSNQWRPDGPDGSDLCEERGHEYNELLDGYTSHVTCRIPSNKRAVDGTNVPQQRRFCASVETLQAAKQAGNPERALELYLPRANATLRDGDWNVILKKFEEGASINKFEEASTQPPPPPEFLTRTEWEALANQRIYTPEQVNAVDILFQTVGDRDLDWNVLADNDPPIPRPGEARAAALARRSPQEAFMEAVEAGDAAMVGTLLQNPRVDPAAYDNAALIRAASSGHTEIVNRLLQDDRVNPAAVDNAPLRWAAYRGHTEIVNRLLQEDMLERGVRWSAAI